MPAAHDYPDAKPDQCILYKSTAEGELWMDQFDPPDASADEPLPSVVFFFGGGWLSGTRRQFHPQSRHLADKGLRVFCADYRVQSIHATDPRASVRDACSAIRYVRAHADSLGVDGQRLAAGGGSAGGHIAAVTGNTQGMEEEGEDLLISSRPNLLLLFNPVLDNGPGGYGFDRVEAYWQSFSPLHNLKADSPPTLIQVGDSDKLVPVSMCEQYQQSLQNLGVTCTLHVYPDQPHGFFNPATPDMYRETVSNMDRFLQQQGWL